MRAWLRRAFGQRPRASGILDPEWARENPFGWPRDAVGAESAMRHAAVFRCVSLIAGAVARLPVYTYRLQPDGDRELNTSHPAAPLLLRRPNPRMSRTMFWRQIVADMLLQGQGIAWIQRRQSGAPLALWPVPWRRVSVQLRNGRLVYQLTLDGGQMVVADQDDVLHFPGSSEWDETECRTPARVYADSVSIGLEANRFARKYFENDATPAGYLTYPQKLRDTKQADEIRAYWQQRFGGENRFRGPAVLTEGGEFKQLSINAEDAQLIETRRFQIEDIGRIFGVPRFLLTLDETSWGSGIEQLGILFVRYTLDPHLQAIRDECDWKLFGTDAHFVDFDTSELMRGDTKAMFEAYRLSLGGNNGPGFLTQNEVRRKLNLPRDEAAQSDELLTWAKPGAASPDGGADARSADPS
jgi:HK97 family phage portal protein